MKDSTLLTLVSLCFLVVVSTKADSLNVDSLQQMLKSQKNEISRIEIVCEIGEFWKGKQSDSALNYFKRASEIVKALPDDSIKLALSAKVNIHLASFYMDLSHVEEARYHDSLALTIASKSGTTAILAKAYNIKGLINYQIGEYDSAINYYRQALALSKKSRDEELSSKIYTNLGIIKFLQGDRDSALICFMKPLEIAAELKNNVLLAGGYYNLGMLKFYSGEMVAAEDYYLKSKHIYGEMRDYSGQILILNALGNIYHTKAEYAKALDNYMEIININRLLDDKLNLARAYHNIAAVYVQIGDESGATNNYLLSIKIKEEAGDKKGIGTDYVGLGILNSNKGNHQQALEYYRKALSFYRTLDYQSGIGTVLGSMASAYYSLHQEDTAIKYYRDAIRIFKEIDNPQGLSDNYLSLAIALQSLSDYDTVMNYYDRAITIKKDVEDNENLGLAYYHLAKFHNALAKNATPLECKNLYQKALDYGRQADKIAVDFDLLSLKNAAAEVLVETYKATGNTKMALQYAEIQIQTADSLFKISKTEAASFAEARWQAQKKQQEILKLNKNNIIQQEILTRKEIESAQQNIVILSLAAIIAALLIIGLLIYFFVKKQRDLQYQKQLNQITKLRFENNRNRLSPHFLFNTLGSITDSLDSNPEVKKMLEAIVRMLRQSLENIEKPEITLAGEIRFVKDYLEIQRNNYCRNVEVIWDIDEKLLQRNIPVMAIQIPVENALKHGLALKTEGKKLMQITAQKTNESMVLTVTDNGIGRNEARLSAHNSGTGTGIKVISQTIHVLNRNNIKPITWQLTDHIINRDDCNGTRVEFVIPEEFNFQL